MNKEVKLIENDLVPVYETDTGQKVVYGLELHEVLGVNTPYRTWAERRFDECEAKENTDFQAVQICTPSGQTKKNHIIALNTAKEMAMLERNEKGKQVRRYFIRVEEKYKEQMIDLDQLNPETKLMNLLVQSISRNELETKRIAAEQKQQAEQLNRIEQKQETIIETFASTADAENFKEWVNKCISRIVESPKFDKGVGTNSKYAFARNESYERLKKKWKCNLDDRVARAKGRALQRNPGISKTELDSINKLTVISADKSLRPVYETIIKEMMIAYCVDMPIQKGVQA